MTAQIQTIAPEALRPRVEGDFANDRVKHEIMARLFAEPAPAAKIGRFTVIRELGRGGTGVVYAAYDEQLERKIAVKLLHVETAETVEVGAGARLLREAQAMARLSHPHIVSVHEVGTHGGQIYIAMEFVHGVTLGAWLKQQPRSWREIVEVFRQAASGLAAAHEVGLVHRDFKPQNAMVGTDGRLRVLDFGLARADGSPEVLADLERTSESNGRMVALEASLTMTGSLIGTPAFMAPEQFRGEKADARSDQFALCVALFEAVYRARPFPGETLQALMHSVLLGRVREPSAAIKLPRALRAAILRGLQLRPAHRHPSMNALIAAIDRVIEPRRRSWLAAGVLAAGVAAGVGGATYHAAEQREVCDGRDAAITEIWSPARAEAIGAALRAVDPLAEEVWPRATARLDAYAASWQQGVTDACLDGEVRREQSQALYDLRRACLDDRLDALRATLDLFERPESILAIRAPDIVAGLAPVESCADPQELARQAASPVDPARAGLVADLRAELARAEAFRRGTLFPEALASLEAIDPRVPADLAPLRADLELTRGRLLSTIGRHKEAARALETAYFTGLKINNEKLAVAAAIDLLRLSSDGLADFMAAKRWGRHAEALLARGGGPALRADLASAHGRYALHTGRYAFAQEQFHLALDLYAQAGLQDAAETAVVQRQLADAAISGGDLDQAEAQLGRAVEVLGREYCDRHPERAAARNSAGLLAMSRGDIAGALASFEKGRTDLTGVVSEDSTVYLQLTTNAAVAHARSGDQDLAVELIRRTLARIDRESGRLDPEMFTLRTLLVNILIHQRDLVAAEAEGRALLGDAERAWGADEPYLAHVLDGLADVALHDGRPADAVPLAERAYRLAEADKQRVQPQLLRASAFVLARALAETGDRARAAGLAREARELAEATHDSDALTAIDAWLAANPVG